MVRVLAPIFNNYIASLAKLEKFGTTSSSDSASTQKAFAELLLLRIFFRLESFIESATIRICCGSRYLDNTRPKLIVTGQSKADAIHKMRSHGRFKADGTPKTIDLKWTMCADIEQNANFVINSSDPFFTTMTNHNAEFDRLRRMRNHIAHGNRDTSRKFRPVVEYHYGASLSHITPGILLLSPRFSPNLLSRAFVFARVFASDLVRS